MLGELGFENARAKVVFTLSGMVTIWQGEKPMK